MASNNLGSRAGPSALSDITRVFMIEGHYVTLFEPRLIEDSVGHKTPVGVVAVTRETAVDVVYISVIPKSDV